MTRITLVLFSLLVAVTAQASAVATMHTFTCKTVKPFGKKYTYIRFNVENVKSPSAKVYYMDWMYDEGVSPVQVKPANSPFKVLNQGFWDGGSRVMKDRFRITADSDGFEYGEMHLFKNSGYQKGYVRSRTIDGKGHYSVVHCKINQASRSTRSSGARG